MTPSEAEKPNRGGKSNGVIDERDAVFGHLRPWIDVNHNGFSEPSETLRSAGIREID
jgi:hypothetical protein